jgi:hypothetical protein
MTELAIEDHNIVSKWIANPYKLVFEQTMTQLAI